MLKRILVLLALLIVASSVAASPLSAPEIEARAATTHTVKIVNKNSVAVAVSLDGTKDYVVDAVKNTTTQVVVNAGTYKISYSTCGDSFSWTRTIDKNITITIEKCVAEEYQFSVFNNTPHTVNVKLDGVQDYTFKTPNGVITRSIKSGTYVISYTVCGKNFRFTRTIDKNYAVEIDACGGDPVKIKFVVFNHFGTDITVNLQSLNSRESFQENYKLQSEFGKNRFDDLWSGLYFFSYDACDQTFSGTVKIEKNGTTTMTLKSCERLIYVAAGAPNPVKARVANLYSASLDVTLIGPETKYLTLSPGMTRVNLLAGSYTYIYAFDGRRYEGVFSVPASGTGVLVLPFSIQQSE